MVSSIAKIPSGVPGLDEIAGGGIPAERVILIVGDPGAGKTILSTQFLVKGIELQGDNGVYVSLDESKEHLYAEMSTFGWNLAQLEEQKKLTFVDASIIRRFPGEVKLGSVSIGKRDFSLIALIDLIKRAVKSIDAKRLVLDSLTALTFNYPNQIEKRIGTVDLIEALSNLKVTCLLTTERGQIEGFETEAYLTHGVILLQTLRVGKNFQRTIQIMKMRGSHVDLQPRRYDITTSGFETYPHEPLFE
jgi:KaiC/GvpD/RAD55 family RecA-like ATPase